MALLDPKKNTNSSRGQEDRPMLLQKRLPTVSRSPAAVLLGMSLLLTLGGGTTTTTAATAQSIQSKSSLSSLLSSSQRYLEDANNYNNANGNYYSAEEYAYDLSSYSIRYEKCQYVRMYDDDMAAAAAEGEDEEDEEENDDNNNYYYNNNGPLALKHFVLFRLCSTDDCLNHQCGVGQVENYEGQTGVTSGAQKQQQVNFPYGKYVTDVDTYLQYTVEQQQQIFENMCENCQNNNNGNDNNNNQYEYEEDGSCAQLCNLYGNMENNGLIDAANYIQCQQLNLNNNNNERRKVLQEQPHRRLEDEQGQQQQQDDAVQQQQQVLYIGPRCSKGDRKIEIGLFKDQYCWDPYNEKSVEEVLGGELSYYFLEHSFTSSSSNQYQLNKNKNNNNGASSSSLCLTCAENDANDNQNDRDDADRVNDMCENLYNAAAKCESPSGITAGFIQTKRDNDEYENQVETEFLSCNFIDSLLWNSYTETGEINYQSRQDVYVRVVTNLQTATMAFLVGLFVVLFGLIHYLQKKIAQVKGAATLQADARAIWA